MGFWLVDLFKCIKDCCCPTFDYFVYLYVILVSKTLLVIGIVCLVMGFMDIQAIQGTVAEKWTKVVVLISIATILNALLGCCGVITKSKCNISIFVLTCLGMFSANLALGIIGYRDFEDKTTFIKTIHTKFKLRPYDAVITNYEIEHKCCGIYGSGDFVSTIPISCCGKRPGEAKTCDSPYDQGCGDLLFDDNERTKNRWCITSFITCILTASAMVFAIILACRIKEEDQPYVPKEHEVVTYKKH